jgi:aminoglycoside 6-adenylyltransferase
VVQENLSNISYEILERRILEWAQNQPEILAVLVVGSRARSDPPPDEWSDLDLILFVQEPLHYANDRSWFKRLGETWLAHQGLTGRGDTEWQLIFPGGLKVDFVFSGIPADLGKTPGAARLAASSPYAFVYQRGVRTLFERYTSPKGSLQALTTRDAVQPPAEAEFQSFFQRLFLSAVRVAKNLSRGETWIAFQQCNCSLKEDLLSLIELHAQDRGTDLWHDGRYLLDWAEPAVVANLPETFSAYDMRGIRQALFASLDLARLLGQEIANHRKFTYPESMDRQITIWLHGVLDG